jgi:deoxyribodipyrimidine photolyase-related protein
MPELRSLVIVLGDQLDANAAAFDGFDARLDAVFMAEVDQESTHVWSSKQRTAVFLAAMRHFALELERRGHALHYRRLDDPANRHTLAAELLAAILNLQPQRLVVTEPGDFRVRQALIETARGAGLALDVRVDRHFFVTTPEFAAHARGRRQLRLEYFYRELRRKHGVLMDADEPVGGKWNFDAENRESFGPGGPDGVPPRRRTPPDRITREVIDLVNLRFAGHPGSLDGFAWPVTRGEALRSLAEFLAERLARFGATQDAMWPGEPWLHHSHLSAALNLKLLNPREVVHAAEAAYRAGAAPLASVEGFIRQILGWREYVRGIYWTEMPGLLERNALGASAPLPPWYWTGATDMACLREVIEQTLREGYAHHIQRLMVTGLYALLLGVSPREVHEWYLAVYVDAVEWVELPNTLGMSQYADGGLMASKPYAASGKYLQRMSGYCRGCRYDPGHRSGDDACPFTTLYWDFLMRHADVLGRNPRMSLQVKNLARLTAGERAAISRRAAAIRSGALEDARAALAGPRVKP